MTFGAHKLVHSEPFSDYLYEVWHCCQRYITSLGKFLYRCTSTFSVLNYYSGIFFKSISYTKWCAQPFPPTFGLFAIFDRNFTKIVAPPSNENENYVFHLKEQSIWKSAETASKSTHKLSHNTCLNYVPHAQVDQAWHRKKHQFSLLQPARVVRSPQTLHADRERRDKSKRCQSFFDPTHSFSCRGEKADF